MQNHEQSRCAQHSAWNHHQCQFHRFPIFRKDFCLISCLKFTYEIYFAMVTIVADCEPLIIVQMRVMLKSHIFVFMCIILLSAVENLAPVLVRQRIHLVETYLMLKFDVRVWVQVKSLPLKQSMAKAGLLFIQGIDWQIAASGFLLFDDVIICLYGQVRYHAFPNSLQHICI